MCLSERRYQRVLSIDRVSADDNLSVNNMFTLFCMVILHRDSWLVSCLDPDCLNGFLYYVVCCTLKVDCLRCVFVSATRYNSTYTFWDVVPALVTLVHNRIFLLLQFKFLRLLYVFFYPSVVFSLIFHIRSQ